MKYVIAQFSGKQILFKPNLWYDINFLKNALVNNFISLNKILLYRDDKKIQIGFPFLTNIQLYAKVIKHFSNKKTIIIKTKPKKNYTRTFGYINKCTRIYIQNIT
jgi:large subunit ribosomal protein L21